MGLDSHGLDQLLTDVHGSLLIYEVYLSVYSVILKIFSVYFRIWVDSFKVVMSLLRIYLFCSFMLFDSVVRLPRPRQTHPISYQYTLILFSYLQCIM